jgi:hypothetical protein
MGLSFIVVFLTGLLKFPELQIFFHLYSYHLPWATIKFLHDWSGIILGVAIIIHLWLHRRWTCGMTKKIFTKKNSLTN